jgi:hypothetical protein
VIEVIQHRLQCVVGAVPEHVRRLSGRFWPAIPGFLDERAGLCDGGRVVNAVGSMGGLNGREEAGSGKESARKASRDIHLQRLGSAAT